MLAKLRLLVIALAAMAVLVSVTVAPAPATAAPPRQPDVTLAAAKVNYSHTAKVSVARYNTIKIAAKLKGQTKGKTLDYRKAVKAFGEGASRTSWRREYAAGWKLGGGKISHVSKAELKKIDQERKEHQPRSSAKLSSSADLKAKAPNCSGRSGYVKKNYHTDDWPNWSYFNSCQTNKLIRNFTWCAGGAGLIAAMIAHPGVSAIMALFVFGCGGSAGWISTAASNSTLNAMIVKTGDIVKYYPEKPTPTNPTRYQVPVKVVPQ